MPAYQITLTVDEFPPFDNGIEAFQITAFDINHLNGLLVTFRGVRGGTVETLTAEIKPGQWRMKLDCLPEE